MVEFATLSASILFFIHNFALCACQRIEAGWMVSRTSNFGHFFFLFLYIFEFFLPIQKRRKRRKKNQRPSHAKRRNRVEIEWDRANCVDHCHRSLNLSFENRNRCFVVRRDAHLTSFASIAAQRTWMDFVFVGCARVLSVARFFLLLCTRPTGWSIATCWFISINKWQFTCKRGGNHSLVAHSTISWQQRRRRRQCAVARINFFGSHLVLYFGRFVHCTHFHADYNSLWCVHAGLRGVRRMSLSSRCLSMTKMARNNALHAASNIQLQHSRVSARERQRDREIVKNNPKAFTIAAKPISFSPWKPKRK